MADDADAETESGQVRSWFGGVFTQLGASVAAAETRVLTAPDTQVVYREEDEQVFFVQGDRCVYSFSLSVAKYSLRAYKRTSRKCRPDLFRTDEVLSVCIGARIQTDIVCR